jgi:hypothetical protein
VGVYLLAEERFASMTSANVKMWRAQEHLESLEKELEAFRKSTDCPMWRECEIDTRQQLWIVDGDLPAPSYRFSLYTGDFLYNTRAALDHLVWDLVISCSNYPTRRNAFPLFDSPQRWERLHEQRLAGINDEIRAEIRDCQPCFGTNPFRNRHLFLLEELCNIDKHRRFNLTTAATDGGFWLPDGLPSPEGAFVHEGGIERGTILSHCPSEHMDVDFGPILGIAFSDGVAAGESVYQVLIAIREVTRMTLDRFKPFLPKVVR